MKAIRYTTYGSPDTLKLVDAPEPTPAPGQLLVKVSAAGLNPYDWHQYRGEPYLIRPSLGIRKPRQTMGVGADFAGVVTERGHEATGFAVGDRVFGELWFGACAEYLVVDATGATKIPAGVSMDAAAATPMGALTALQGLRDVAQLQPGQSVLVNGASGGVGHFAVQIAKALGARNVTAVCSAKNADWVRACGADATVDYTTTDFTTLGERYDVIYDTVGGHGARAMNRALTRTGVVAIAGSTGMGKLLGPASHIFSSAIGGMFIKPRIAPVMAKNVRADLDVIADWLGAGTIAPRIDRTFSLAQTADAMRYLETGRVAGKLVVAVTGE